MSCDQSRQEDIEYTWAGMLRWPGPVKSIVPRGDISYQKKRTYKSAGYMEKQGDQTGVSSTGQRRRRGRRGGSAARRGAGKKRAGSGGEPEISRSPARFSPAMRQSVMEPWRSGAPRESRGRGEKRKALRNRPRYPDGRAQHGV